MFGLSPDLDTSLILAYLGLASPVFVYCLVTLVRRVLR